jgi:hypothetical protein
MPFDRLLTSENDADKEDPPLTLRIEQYPTRAR